MKTSGFKRAAYVRPPVSPPRPVRAVAKTVIDGPGLIQPKTVQHRNPHLLSMARGMTCLLRVPGVCQGGTETTVAAHSNWAIHGKSGARKADDCYSVWSCAACHIGWLDQGKASKQDKQAAFMAGHVRQVEQWRLIATEPGAKPADKKAAAWALDLLNATLIYPQIQEFLY